MWTSPPILVEGTVNAIPRQGSTMGPFDKLIGTQLARGVWSWTADDALIYALGVGAGLEQPYAELQFTTENTEGLPQKVIPTFLTLMSTSELWMRPLGFREREWEGLSWGWPEGLVHGEQGITLARPLPTAGTADISLELVGVHDKGSGALVIADTHVRLAGSGELLGTARAGMFIRGQGGFGGPPAPREAEPWAKPEREPDAAVVHHSSPGQSLIYRLSGDRNPHCTDPARAKADGFDRPIFQGLGTLGFACRALIQTVCDGDSDRFRTMSARFASPMFPGETLTTLIWRIGNGARFQMIAGDGRPVLERGTFGLAR
jgi:acyl dehydratase